MAASAHVGKAEEAKAKESLRELIDKLGRTQELVARVDPALAVNGALTLLKSGGVIFPNSVAFGHGRSCGAAPCRRAL